ncbi:MAG: hypothetical protein PUB43_05330 [Oscillospiraceae bacterium]|nr:hypothetical protein [Oscillospiraceae bacterium]
MKFFLKKSELIRSQSDDINDVVIFMAAYSVNKINKSISSIRNKKEICTLLKQCHIIGLSDSNSFITTNELFKYKIEYDSIHNVFSFLFEKSIENLDKDVSQELYSILSLQESIAKLLDISKIKHSVSFCMENFLVKMNSKTYQVKPLAFILNGVLIINYELIDFETEKPLDSDSIYGRSNNFGIMTIESRKYFDEMEFLEENAKISDIIFDNILNFLNHFSTIKSDVQEFSFVHNTFVLSNRIKDISKYFQDVLGAQIVQFNIDNISSTDKFNYYSKEYLGVLTNIKSDIKKDALMDCMVLESFKTFMLLEMILDSEINSKLDKIINHQIYVESLLCPSHVPIITINLLDNLKKTISFHKYKEKIDFKIKTLSLVRDRQRISNERLLNILLYFLTVIGCVQTLPVLENEFDISFETSLIVLIIFAVFTALIWFIREIKK